MGHALPSQFCRAVATVLVGVLPAACATTRYTRSAVVALPRTVDRQGLLARGPRVLAGYPHVPVRRDVTPMPGGDLRVASAT
jgi:hypothetical protein